jgi:hypothetical protein
VKPQRPRDLALDPTRALCPLDARQGRALGTRPLVGVGWRLTQAVIATSDGPHPTSTNTIGSQRLCQRLPLGVTWGGSKGVKPLGGFQGEALIFTGPNGAALDRAAVVG